MLNRFASFASNTRSLRTYLVSAFGALIVLIVAVLSTALLSLTFVGQRTEQAINVDGKLSRLASDIATHTLLSRRFEKDVFLNVDNAERQAEYLAKWTTAVAQLEQGISAYTLVAVTPADQQQAATWSVASKQYRQAVEQVVSQIQAGRIRTPQDANATLTPVKEPIRTLTETSVAVAEQRAQEVQAGHALLMSDITARSLFVLVLGLAAVFVALLWSILVPRRLMQPITMLNQATQRFAAGSFDTQLTLDRRDELGALADSFNSMARTISQRTAELEAQQAASELARQEAVNAQVQLAQQLRTIEQQQQVIRELSVPTLPLSPTVLIMPLIGALDTDRLTTVQEQALQNIESSRARFLLLDITAVPVIDTQVAQGLIQVVKAARLLGAEVVVVGIRPEVAQTIVSLGIVLGSITTCSSLHDGVEYTQRRSALARQARLN